MIHIKVTRKKATSVCLLQLQRTTWERENGEVQAFFFIEIMESFRIT